MPKRSRHTTIQVILTHEHTDFDGLASLLAASKLYPSAIPVLPRRPNRNLRHFLTLYWDVLPFVLPDDLPRARVERAIIVDTQSVITVRGMDAETEILFIDHHRLERELKTGMTFEGEELGAVTTLLVEKIFRSGLSLTPIEATLLMLGIYEDTGSLSYASTTPRDIRAAAWLAEQGSKLDTVSDFLHYPLSNGQRTLYEQLLENSHTYRFNGQSVVVSAARAQEYVEEISTLAHKLRDLLDPAALFLLVDLGDHLQLVARSTTESIDVSAIAAEFGGGGHTRASAALIRGLSLDDATKHLLNILDEQVQPSVTVAQIMSHGVHTLPPTVTVSIAAGMMQRYGHEGFPIVQEGQVVGMLTRREIDRALSLGLGGAAIDTYMRKGRIQVSPRDSVERVQQVMMEHGVGQVPVVQDGEVIGIVTRTDLIKLWSTPPRRSRREEIAWLMDESLPPGLLSLAREASAMAADMGFSLYFVGGFVRDLLLGQPNFDADLVVEGDAIALARRLADEKGGRVRGHARFGTAKWILDDPAEFDIASVDFVTARTEFYRHPSALPEIERSSIRQDLHRRDFTINTLAICLDPGHWGELLDFYGGEEDLKQGVIRVLHSLSFVEDPTRMLRAARFEQRLGFRIEPRTEELIHNALGLLDRVSGERIRHELYLILQEEAPEKALCRLTELNVLTQIHPGLRCDAWMVERIQRLQQRTAEWHQATALLAAPEQDSPEIDSPPGPEEPSPAADRALLYLALLTYRLIPGELETLIERLRIVRDDADRLRQVAHLRPVTVQLARERHKPSELDRLLHDFSGVAIFVAWVAGDSALLKDQLIHYWRDLCHVQPEIDGNYLKGLGLQPGPIYSRILNTVRAAKLDGEVKTRAEQEALVAALLTDMS
ncbi:MAG: CBS domain-containing protein [Chloroflexota bacterium]